MEFEWPFCAVCNRGVEKVERFVDPFSNDVHYVVHCHGTTETQVIRGLDLHDQTWFSRA